MEIPAPTITGTQISSCLRKNLRNGIRRLSWYCSTRISTQLWWLLVTKYECCLSKPLSPATSQCVRPTRFIQNLLMEIQASALACIIKRRMRCTSGMGTSSFTSARINSGQHQNRVLSANIRPASRPRSGAGRKCSIGAGASRKWGQAGCGPLLWRSSGLIPDLSTPAVLHRRSVGAQVNVCAPNCNPSKYGLSQRFADV